MRISILLAATLSAALLAQPGLARCHTACQLGIAAGAAGITALVTRPTRGYAPGYSNGYGLSSGGYDRGGYVTTNSNSNWGYGTGGYANGNYANGAGYGNGGGDNVDRAQQIMAGLKAACNAGDRTSCTRLSHMVDMVSGGY